MKRFSLFVATASFSFLSFFLVSSQANSQMLGGFSRWNCEQWHYGTDFKTLPAAYGLPYSLFFTTRTEQGNGSVPPTFIKVICSDTDWHDLEVGGSTLAEAYAVYQYAYEWNGESWQRITLSGDPLRGNNNWLSRIGEAGLKRTRTELLETNFIAAYVCENVENEWKCGCRDVECNTHGWQLQYFP